MSSHLPVPRLIRASQDPLGLYLRVGRNDHRYVSAAIASGRRQFNGVVVEAHRVQRHRELLDQVESARLESVLDPCTQAMAMPGGYSEALGQLPWGSGHRHRLRDFDHSALLEKVTSIARFAVQHRFSEVLAPTHVLNGVDDPWLSTDIDATRALRAQLDRSGGRYIGLIYLLTIPYSLLRNAEARQSIVKRLTGLPIDALWIRVDPFGDNSTGAAVRNYLEASSEFHRLGVPLVADLAGGLVGLSLLAAAAVGGISHGITQRERFDGASWKEASAGAGFAMPHRVYLAEVDLYLKSTDAKRLFDNSLRLREHFGCHDPKCCPRGVTDMVGAPGLHFLTRRMAQLVELGQIPQSLRPQVFLERYLRPTADAVTRFSSSKALDPELLERMVRHRKRLDLFRVSLEDLFASTAARSTSVVAETRASREHRMSR